MIKKWVILLAVAACYVSVQAASFDTQRLERLAGYLNLQQLDTLPIGVTNTYSFKQHPLTIRKNKWGEIEHIGLLLFPQVYRQQALPIYDFLERYLLARLATPEHTEDAFKMQWDKVHFSVGTPVSALKIDTTVVFYNEYVDLHVYRVSWSVNNNKILELSFTMDYQLMTGCDAVELELRFMRLLSRFQTGAVTKLDSRPLPQKGTEFIRTDTYYMSPMVRNDIYFTRKSENKTWQLVCDVSRPTKTINNWMVAEDSDNKLPLEIQVDRYGYELDSLQTTYRAWQQFCISEGCMPYFGLKSKRRGWYEGSVFMVNRTGGYVHLLSISIPESALKDRRAGQCYGRMFAYIPLYNVNAKLLHNVEYVPIK